jgi:hypothetical protein
MEAAPFMAQDAMAGEMIAAQGMPPLPEPEAYEEEIPDIKDPTGGQEPILPEVQDRNATVQLIRTLFARYMSEREQIIENNWTLSEQLYLGEVKDDISPYQSLYEIREIYRQVESQKARSFAAFFGQLKNFEYRTRHPGGEDAAGRASYPFAEAEPRDAQMARSAVYQWSGLYRL